MKLKAYISLPISGRFPEEARKDASLAAEIIETRMGMLPINPFDIYAGIHPTYFDHICSDLRTLLDCQRVVLLPGWKKSRGCRLEKAAAEIYGIPTVELSPQMLKK